MQGAGWLGCAFGMAGSRRTGLAWLNNRTPAPHALSLQCMGWALGTLAVLSMDASSHLASCLLLCALSCALSCAPSSADSCLYSPCCICRVPPLPAAAQVEFGLCSSRMGGALTPAHLAVALLHCLQMLGAKLQHFTLSTGSSWLHSECLNKALCRQDRPGR